MPGKKIYFASDFHLGAPDLEQSIIRERKIVQWLDHIKKEASDVFLLGDVFDFWFEYKYVVPKGGFRLLAKLDELSVSGIHIHIFTGNHDMWLKTYLTKQIKGLTLYYEKQEFTFHNKTFLLGHGDGLGPKDYKYKLLKKVFKNRFCQFLFARLHPNLSFFMAHKWSKYSRHNTPKEEQSYLGDQQEYLFQYCKRYLQTKNAKIDYFIFGHRHLPIEKSVGNAKYINTGDWLSQPTYAVFDGIHTQLLTL